MGQKFEFIVRLVKYIGEHELTARGAQLSYFLILSIFPFLIFLITLLDFTPLTNQETLRHLSLLLPETAYRIVEEIVSEVVSANHSTFLSVGFLGTIWTASRGTTAVISSINQAYKTKESRSFIVLNLIGVAAVVILGLIILTSLTLLIFGQVLGELVFGYLGLEHFFYVMWAYLRYLIPCIAIFLSLCALYKYAPNVTVNFRSVYPGAVTATVGWIVTSQVFAYYVNNFGNYSRTYGSIGGIIVFLIWLYLSSVVLLIGGEINALVYNYNKDNDARRHFF